MSSLGSTRSQDRYVQKCNTVEQDRGVTAAAEDRQTRCEQGHDPGHRTDGEVTGGHVALFRHPVASLQGTTGLQLRVPAATGNLEDSRLCLFSLRGHSRGCCPVPALTYPRLDVALCLYPPLCGVEKANMAAGPKADGTGGGQKDGSCMLAQASLLH